MKQPLVQFGALSVVLGLGTGSIWYFSGNTADEPTPTAEVAAANDSVPRNPMFASGPIASATDEARAPSQPQVATASRGTGPLPDQPTRPVALPPRSEDSPNVLLASVSSAGPDAAHSASVSVAPSKTMAETMAPSAPAASDMPTMSSPNSPEHAALAAALQADHAAELEPPLARGQEPRQLQAAVGGGNPLRASGGVPTPAVPPTAISVGNPACPPTLP